jgi:hypothetical protein
LDAICGRFDLNKPQSKTDRKERLPRIPVTVIAPRRQSNSEHIRNVKHIAISSTVRDHILIAVASWIIGMRRPLVVPLDSLKPDWLGATKRIIGERMNGTGKGAISQSFPDDDRP